MAVSSRDAENPGKVCDSKSGGGFCQINECLEADDSTVESAASFTARSSFAACPGRRSRAVRPPFPVAREQMPLRSQWQCQAEGPAGKPKREIYLSFDSPRE